MTTPDPGTGPDAGSTPDGATGADGGRDTDAGSTPDAASDARFDAQGYPHKYGDAGADATCEFNRSCVQGLRCECNGGDCFCKTGKRGEGRAGVDPCTTGNDCGSSICINDQWCSDECTTPADCGPKTPRCIPVFGFSAKICAPP